MGWRGVLKKAPLTERWQKPKDLSVKATITAILERLEMQIKSGPDASSLSTQRPYSNPCSRTFV
ncbi:hypothetical protein ASZ90_011853 [hydrocarbon metagenome]|jgi:hypothetical protein|uniref:Uncharacterized protein n=1 Tax=hydrocarbon metagenome TaxID=938273 RepID=A0A0W8FC08_9ZZZZ